MNQNHIQLSKSLSWILRHGALKEGFHLSPEGYIDVNLILAHRSLKGKFDRSDIEHVVKCNDKQRFKLRLNPLGVLEIKANQGHSISEVTNTELTPILEAKYKTLIHGTYIKCWPQIKKLGLSRMKRNHIHFSKGAKENIISGIRSNAQLHIYIDLEKALSDGLKFYESENGVILTPGNQRGFLESKYFSKVINLATGYPTYAQETDIITLFSRDNVDVQVENMTRQMATVIFPSPEEAEQAIELSGNICLYGSILTVMRYNARNDPAEGRNHRSLKNNRNNAMNFPKSKQKGEIIDPSMIDLSGTFEDQLEQILANVRLTQQEAASLGRLYADVEMVLQDSWPGCVALPFGSITTGLGLKTSDADCFVLLPPTYRQSYPQDYFVPRAKRLLQTRPDLFTEILCIPRANTPIVKFFHLPTGTNCDVSFKTLLGVQNSKLIGFLLHADPRILPLAIIIRYWAKVHELSGSGRLTNYALTLLVIFYLQQPKRPLLPPVEWLQRNRADDFAVDGWNTGFSADYSRLSRNINTMSLVDLLGGFFKFYTQFDFEQMVVCPYMGYAMYKTQFTGETELSDHFSLYVRNVRDGMSAPLKCTTPMCVQDPLELSHNVASSVNHKHHVHMQAFFKYAADAHEANDANGFLKTILLTKPAVVQKVSYPEYKINLYPNLFGNAIGDWRFKLWEMLITIFEIILKIPLNSIDVGLAPCGKKEKLRYLGTITSAVWKRKQFSRLYNFMRMDFLERESRITDEIVNVNRQELNLRFGLTMSYFLGTRNVRIQIKLVEGDPDTFKQFGNFFNYVLPDWFKILSQYDLSDVELRQPSEVKKRWGERPSRVSSMGVNSRAVREAERVEGERATQFRIVRDAESACVRRWEEMRKLRESLEAISLTDPFNVVE